MGDSGDQQIDGARIVGATGPQYSADGRWVWDGRQWIPAPPVETTLHQFSDVGAILYDGRANFLTHCECRITNRRVILQSDRAGMHQIPLSIVTKVKPNFGLISSELDVDLPGMTFRFTGNGKEKTLALYRAIQEATLDSPQQRIDDPHRQNAQTADSEPTAPLPRRRAYQGRSGPVAMGGLSHSCDWLVGRVS